MESGGEYWSHDASPSNAPTPLDVRPKPPSSLYALPGFLRAGADALKNSKPDFDGLEVADALQKAASIFVSYLTTCSHEAARVHQEERHQQKRQRTSAGMAGPDSVKTLTKQDVMTAVELMCPEILQQLRARPSVPHRASAAEPGVLFVRRGVRQGLRPRACQGSARGAESAAQSSD